MNILDRPRITMTENVWHRVNEKFDNCVWMYLPEEQMNRIHFASNLNGVQYFIILPNIPNGKHL